MDSVVLSDYYTKPWFSYVTPELQGLIKTGIGLYEHYADQAEKESAGFRPADYGFMVFPFSKGYEGFLKHYLLDLNLISKEAFDSRRFRIGRAINPDVSHHHRDEDWVFDDLADQCGTVIARQLWITWLESRNRIFHYFPKKYQPTTLKQALDCCAMVLTTIDQAVACQPDLMDTVRIKNTHYTPERPS